jgi:APA family basic amino acid/polyamine antiporter
MALVMWLVTGLINLVSAFCYAELALTFRAAGSDYTYMRTAFGDLVGFLYMWVVTVFRESCSRSILALTFSTYFCQIFVGK